MPLSSCLNDDGWMLLSGLYEKFTIWKLSAVDDISGMVEIKLFLTDSVSGPDDGFKRCDDTEVIWFLSTINTCKLFGSGNSRFNSPWSKLPARLNSVLDHTIDLGNHMKNSINQLSKWLNSVKWYWLIRKLAMDRRCALQNRQHCVVPWLYLCTLERQF